MIRVRASVSVSFAPWKIFKPGKQDAKETAPAFDALRTVVQTTGSQISRHIQ